MRTAKTGMHMPRDFKNRAENKSEDREEEVRQAEHNCGRLRK